MKILYKLPIVLLVATFYLLLSTFNSSAQNIGINTTGATPDESALLDLSSTDKGFLITRADTASIASPAFGLMTLAPSDSCLYMFSGEIWISIGGVGSNCGGNSSGTSFNCGDSFTDPRDGKTYETVQIGSQCWMSENMNYTPSSDNSWCYEDDDSNCDTYGRLYDWDTATNSTSSDANPSGVQGVCPSGWHLPSDDEWKQLEMQLGMSQTETDNTVWRGTNEGDALKTSSWGGDNSSGFTALPGGVRFDDGFSINLGSGGDWWSATESTDTNAWSRGLTDDESKVYRNAGDKTYAHSVRCIMD